jgi:hypothetical protein
MAGEEMSFFISPAQCAHCSGGGSDIRWMISTLSLHFWHWYSYSGIRQDLSRGA